MGDTFRARRFARIGRIAVREAAPVVVRRRQPVDFDRLSASCQELGATFVKLGQLVASAPGLVGEDVAASFRPLLDGGPAVPFPEVRRVVENELGGPLARTFRDFDETPLAAASLAVVHRATLTDGREVAVKVLRPDVGPLVATDLALVMPAVTRLAAISGVRQAFILQGLVEGLAEQLDEELDLRNEAGVMRSMRTMLTELEEDRIVVPEPLADWSGRRVLTMEFLDGVAIDDDTALDRLGLEARPLVEALVRAWFMGVIRDGVFHGDIHAGNLLLLRDGRAGVLDWGIVGRLEPDTHRFFRRMLDGVLGDESAWPEVAANVIDRFIPADHPMAGTITPDDLVPLVRERAHDFLAKPFGEVSLADVIEGPPLPDGFAEDEWPPLRVMAGRWAAGRLGIRTRWVPPPSPAFDRGMFLLVKQLVYFERYGRKHMADRALFDDAELHRAARAVQNSR